VTWAIDVALAAVAVEALLLARVAKLREVVATLAAGVLLMLAVRFALSGQPGWAVAFVAASGPAHGWDVVRRFKGRGESG
jgi:hypothetical protein